MKIGGFALRHRALLLLVFMGLSACGVISATRLASGIYPEMDFPRISILLRGGDDPPDVFERSTTRPVEQALLGVLGVERVRSRTLRGGADLQLLFAPGTDMWRALQLVTGSLGDARAGLPPEVSTTVERVTPVSFPILSFNVTGAADPRDLRDAAELVFRPILARGRGIGSVGIVGGDVREIEIVVDPARAAALRLSYESLAASIRRSLPRIAVGRGTSEHAALTMIASAPQLSVSDLGGIIVAISPEGTPVPLSSLARITVGAEDRLSETRGPAGPAVLVTVSRVDGASTPAVVSGALTAATTAERSLPPSIRIEPVYDQGALVTDSIHGVRDAIALGILLSIVVLGLVLRDVRAGLVAASAVPVTLAITFLAMQLLGQTLNLMSLGGMAVSIGLVVDDAIVVVEAIARRLEEGATPEDAAKKGTDDLAPAVIGTTATTVVVFLPLSFLDGVIGTFFQTLAKTLSAAVLISLAVSLAFVPILAARVMKARSRTEATGEERLSRVARFGARRPWFGAAFALVALGFVGFVGPRLPSGLMPSCDEGAFVLDYFAPSGTSLEDTSKAASAIERILRETPEVETFSRRTGVQINPTAIAPMNQGDFVVRLKPGTRRHVDLVIDDVRARVEREVPAVRAEYVKLLEDMLNDLSGTPRPVEVRVFGDDRAAIERVAGEVALRLGEIPGVVDVYGGVERPSLVTVADVDRAAAARVGLTPDEVAFELRDAFLGTRVGSLPEGERILGVRLRAPDEVRSRSDALGSLPLSSPRGGELTLGAIASVSKRESATELVREGLQPVVIVTADLEGRDLGSVHTAVDRALAEISRPRGVRLEVGGQLESQRSARTNLLLVGASALGLVLVVLVAQFRNLRSAAAVLLTAPIAIAFALAGLWITKTPLDVSSMMGCVLLLGLVVKNGILLVEASDRARADGVALEEAIGLAVRRRLRPIVMTTGATLAGMLPLAFAFGAGAELQRPLAIAVLSGLLFSTLANLVVLPALVRALR